VTGASPALALPTASPELAERLLAGLASVDELLRSVVDHEDPFIAEASMHLSDAGGKRFRPMLTLLAAELGTGINPEVVKAATGVELTHLASLYHDDVMDEADLRRGVVSANARYGNSEAILIGDLLFGKASELVADLGPEAVRIQAQTFVRLCSGQIRDARPVPEGVDPIDYYLGVLADKTGVLIATAARYGSLVRSSGSSAGTRPPKPPRAGVRRGNTGPLDAGHPTPNTERPFYRTRWKQREQPASGRCTTPRSAWKTSAQAWTGRAHAWKCPGFPKTQHVVVGSSIATLDVVV